MTAETGSRGRAASATSGHLDTRTAATEVAHALHDQLGGGADLAVVFASFHHRAALPEAAETIRRTLSPRTLLAVTAESVLGGAEELEGVAGLGALALSLPGVTLSPWILDAEDESFPLDNPSAVADRLAISDGFRGALVFGDPFSMPVDRLLDTAASCEGATGIFGAMASGASQPGNNVLVLDDRVLSAGAIGVSFAGPVEIDVLLSQGCRPIGKSHVVTRANDDVVLELGGQAPLGVLKEIALAMDEQDREMLNRGLLLGLVIDERKSRFGRGDFLIRNVIGLDQKRGSVMVAATPRVGQTVQFHVRDAVTASEDLQLLLDAQMLREPSFGGLLFTCNSRGKRLFESANHDVGAVQGRLGPLPLAGFFAAGEIGPVGGRSHVHGHTACLALFRAP